ncbi:hypothetical protein TNCV_558831 [Trichonephila clavipes]|nr:hypothetical protein TNCV_558831 [Trichonephila clavipes]
MDPEGHKPGFQSGGQSDAKTLSVKFPSKLGTHFIDPLKGCKAEPTLPRPGFEPRACVVEARCTNHSAPGLRRMIMPM